MEDILEVFLRFFNISLTASWIILAVILLRFLLKKAPKWINCLLWGIVGIRLVFPFSIESIFSLIPSNEVISPDIIYSPSPSISTGIPAVNTAINPVISEAFAPDPSNSVNPLQVVCIVASNIWIIGIVAMLIYSVVCFWLLKRKMRTAVRYEGNIYQSENVQSPFILGVTKPKIYLPYGIDEKSINYIISHERAHLKRKDHLIKPLAFLVLSVYWFNPMMWVAYVLLCRDIELACDEKAVKNLMKQQRREYSLALVQNSTNRRMVAACPLAFGEVGIKERVKSVVNYKKPAFWVIVVAIISCVVTSVCFLTDPVQDKPKSDYDQYYAAGYTVENAEDKRCFAINSALTNQLPVREDLPFTGVSHIVLGSEAARNETGKKISETVAVLFNRYRYNYADGKLLESGESNRAILEFEFDSADNYVLKSCREFAMDGKEKSFEEKFNALATLEYDSEETTASLYKECRKTALDFFGLAEWVHMPMLSSTQWAFFPIVFSMDYEKIEIQCSDGYFIDIDAPYPEEQSTGNSLTFQKGHNVYWYPRNEDETDAQKAELTFCVYLDSGSEYQGIINITAQNEDSGERGTRYIADMNENELIMSRSDNNCAIVRLGQTVNQIRFYNKPTLETETRRIALLTVPLESSEIEKLQQIIKNASWIDDNDVKRKKYSFDGELVLDDNITYFFSDENNILYYNHYLAEISGEDMDYITARQGVKNYSYESGYDSATLELSLEYKSFSFSYSLLSSHIAHGDYYETDKTLVLKESDSDRVYTFQKEDGNLIFDAENSSPIPEYYYGKDQGIRKCIPHKAVFRQ